MASPTTAHNAVMFCNTISYFNVRATAEIGQPGLPHGNKYLKMGKMTNKNENVRK